MKTRDGHHVINFNTLNVIQSLKILVTDDIVLDCYLISSEQYFNYILDKTPMTDTKQFYEIQFLLQ
jgi:hypothetical protein